MTSLKQNFYTLCGGLLIQLIAASGSLAWAQKSSDSHHHATSDTQRFVKIDNTEKRLADLEATESSWACILDNKTGLLWEIKTNDGRLQDRLHRYNGGIAGYENKGQCNLSLCNTHAYIYEINRKKLCGSTEWRLPSREELRSIVDYHIKYPGPTINTEFFPNTLNQFYWSSVPDANDKDSAWGIGFSFGYDYAYFKSDLGYVRLVSEYHQ